MEFQPKVWWKKTGDYPDPKVTNIFIQSQPPKKKNQKTNHFVDCLECQFCGLWIWSLKLKPQKKKKEKEKEKNPFCGLWSLKHKKIKK